MSLNVNGDIKACDMPPAMRLSAVLRDVLYLTSVKEACCEGVRGMHPSTGWQASEFLSRDGPPSPWTRDHHR